MPVIPVRVDPAIRAHVVRHGMSITNDHPLAGTDCPVCDRAFGDTEPLALVYVGRFPDDPGGWTAAAVAVHDGCTDMQ